MNEVKLRLSHNKNYEVPLHDLRSNSSNPRDSAPDITSQGYGIFEATEHPAIMEMALSGDPAQERAFCDLIETFDVSLAGLAADMLGSGVLQPIRVSPLADGGYDVVFGCRRVLAMAYNHCKTHAAQVPTITATLLEMNSVERAFAAFSENYNRRGQTAIDEAKQYQKLINLGQSPGQIAERAHVGEAHVKERLKLNLLSPEVQNKVAAGKITLKKAGALADNPDLTPEQVEKKLAKKASAKLPSSRELKLWYEEDMSLSEEVRKFIAGRLLKIRYEPR